MKATRNRRKKHFSDRAVQGTLLLHIVAQWLFFLLTAGAFLVFVELVSGDPRDVWQNMLHRNGPSALAILVLGPLFLRDLCKLTNRFAGPLLRLRRGLRDLAEGKEVAPIHFRDHDFWQDLATSFNRVVERVQGANTGASNVEAPLHHAYLDDSREVAPPELAQL